MKELCKSEVMPTFFLMKFRSFLSKLRINITRAMDRTESKHWCGGPLLLVCLNLVLNVPICFARPESSLTISSYDVSSTNNHL
jgi:hypothetical protein